MHCLNESIEFPGETWTNYLNKRFSSNFNSKRFNFRFSMQKDKSFLFIPTMESIDIMLSNFLSESENLRKSKSIFCSPEPNPYILILIAWINQSNYWQIHVIQGSWHCIPECLRQIASFFKNKKKKKYWITSTGETRQWWTLWKR